MNLLVVNASTQPVKPALLDFLVTKDHLISIIILEQILGLNSSPSVISENHNPARIFHRLVDFSDNDKLIQTFEDLHNDFQTFHGVIFIEEFSISYNGSFADFNILEFKELLFSKLQLMISFLQILVQKIKEEDLSSRIILLVPNYAQTKLYDGNIPRSILVSAHHMIFTAFADEIVDKGWYCNGILENTNYLTTLQWLLFETEEKFYGKLFEGKNVINW